VVWLLALVLHTITVREVYERELTESERDRASGGTVRVGKTRATVRERERLGRDSSTIDIEFTNNETIPNKKMEMEIQREHECEYARASA